MRWRESAERDKIELDVKTLAVAVFFHAVYGVASRKVKLSTLSEARNLLTTRNSPGIKMDIEIGSGELYFKTSRDLGFSQPICLFVLNFLAKFFQSRRDLA